MIFVIKFYDACIVFKDANAPIVWPQTLSNLDGCGKDSFLEHALKMPRTFLVAIFNFAAERLVTAVLAPRLSDCFQFNIGRITVLFAEVLLNRFHLGNRQIELACFAQEHEPVVIEVAYGYYGQIELVRRTYSQLFESQRS